MKKLKTVLFFGIALLSVLLITGCASEKTPYDRYDGDGYTVSVRYDANGGSFTTNTEVIVDSYKLSELKTGADGKKEIALISPDNAVRGSGNAFRVTRSGYFLAGWYTERYPVLDAAGNHLDEDGNIAASSGKDPAYTYGGMWNFASDRYKLDPNGNYTSKEPQLTLYAAWVPEFTYNFYAKDSGALLGSYVINPFETTEIPVPQWNESTGKQDLYNFPKVAGKTFQNVYLSANSTEPVSGSVIAHTGKVNLENATATGASMSLYVDLIDGEWFRISTAEQFVKNASLSACYEICADLDFANEIWPTTLMHGNFTGRIRGNGHTLSNVKLTQTNTSRPYAGLFGQLGDGAAIENITFEKVTVTLEKGTRTEGARFGLLAGTVANSATLQDVKILDSVLQISCDCMLPNDYEIGLLCGLGSTGDIDLSGIRCEALNREGAFSTVHVETDGNSVTVTFEPAA